MTSRRHHRPRPRPLQTALTRAALTALCALAAPRLCPRARAAAPDTSDLEALLGEAVVTTASRSAERASVAPAAVFNITAAEIAASGARTVDEALELLGQGVYVAKPRDYISGSDVGAQGLLLRDAGRHVLVLLDGVILNSQGTGNSSLHEALGVPLDLIDHIEVLLGPGSVIYGSNAMLAVINVVSKRARDLRGVVASAEIGSAAPQGPQGEPLLDAGRPGLRYRLALGGGATFKLGPYKGEVTAMLEWLHDRTATYGTEPFTTGEAYNQSFLPGQTSWGGLTHHEVRAPSGALTLRLGELKLLVSAVNYHRGMPLVGTFSDPTSREEQTAVRVELSHSRRLGSRFTLDSRLYGGYSSHAERSSYGESFWCPDGQSGCRFDLSAATGHVGLEQRVSADWFTDGKLLTMLGYDLRPRFFATDPASYTDLASGLPSTVVPTPHASEISLLGALFAQQVWRPRPWVALNVGARVDFQSQFGARLSPRAAVVFTPGTQTVLRMSYSEAFRAPSPYELTEFDPTFRITPQSLRPETVRSVELEGQQRLGRFHLALRGYAAFYDDMIETRAATAAEMAPFSARLSPTVDPSVVVVNDNLTSLRVLGGSAAVQAQLPLGFSLGVNVHSAHAQTGEGERYERMPLFFGNFRLGWRSSEDGYSVMLLGIYAAERLVLVNATPTDAHLGPRLDLRLTGAGPLGGVRGLRWRTSLGFALNPALPYAISVDTDTPSGQALYPSQPRLFGFLGVVYLVYQLGQLGQLGQQGQRGDN